MSGLLPLSKLLCRLYGLKMPRTMRRVVLALVKRLEGGEMYSETLRAIFSKYYNIEIGKYSYGGCFNQDNIRAFTKIGRYCSFADGVRVINVNHPLEFKSTHPFFFNPIYRYVTSDLRQKNRITIGNDVWVGCNAIILPKVCRIGDGAVIGASAVVTEDVPDFAVVACNPAKVIKYRFSPKTIERIKASRWWDKDIEHLKDNLQEFLQPLESDNGTIHTT